jgi:two-component system sensor histidine kinase BaeS
VGPVPGRAYERLATSFDDMAHKLQTNEARRRELLADIAHELRTPLQAIRGTVDGMREGLYPADEEHLRSVAERTEVMARLLEDLRTLSMAEAGVLDLHTEAADPRGVVTDAIAGVRAEADDAGVRIEDSIGANVPSTIEIDPVRITEVLTNLLQNAITHSPQGSVVTVSLEHGKAAVRFEVHDQGSGIPPNKVDHIFDRFVTSADRGGTGLGLAIAKRLVDAHGGTLVVAQTSSAGTTMRFDLPIDTRDER